MKKILSILFSFLGVGLLICIIIGFCRKIDVILLPKAVFKYKLFTGIELFSKILPALVLSGFVLSCSIQFGRNSEGSTARFSPAMLGRFKTVIIASVICTALLTVSTEALGITLSHFKTKYVNQPRLVSEYVKTAQNMLEKGNPNGAARYAIETLVLDPTNQEAKDIKDQADIIINQNEFKNIRQFHETNLDSILQSYDTDIDTNNLLGAYGYYKLAKESYENKEWFNAHYFAECGLQLASGKDPNYMALRELSSSAWNNISEIHDLSRTDDQNLFLDKYEGYKALMEEDYLKAYYILKNIQLDHPELKNDSDLYFYEALAEQKVNERFFFMDEALDLQSFETANDVYFSIKDKDGWTDLIYFKGVTEVRSTGSMVQYLRDFSVITMDENGEMHRTLHVPYAKVLSQSLKSMNPLTKDNLGIDRNIDNVPYILLHCIDRVDEGKEIRPEYVYADSDRFDGPEYLLLRIPFADFLLLENATINPDTLSLPTLLSVIKKAARYGYSSEVYGQILLNRVLYPLFLLLTFILLACLSWNNRIGATTYFKTIWILIFPAFAAVCGILYQAGLFLFKLANYALLSFSGINGALMWGAVFYFAALILASIIFTSQKASE